GKLAQRFFSAERVGMRCADEAAGIITLGLLRRFVAQARSLGIRAHAGGAGQQRNVDACLVHHADMLIEIEQHPVHDEAGRAVLVIAHELALPEVLRHQRARREMMLEVDNHGFPPVNEDNGFSLPQVLNHCYERVLDLRSGADRGRGGCGCAHPWTEQPGTRRLATEIAKTDANACAAAVRGHHYHHADHLGGQGRLSRWWSSTASTREPAMMGPRRSAAVSGARNTTCGLRPTALWTRS